MSITRLYLVIATFTWMLPTANAMQKPVGIAQMIKESIQIKAGEGQIAEKQNVFLSTENVSESVTIVFQHADAKLVALYHYYQDADENFTTLDVFLNKLIARAEDLSLNKSDFKVSLISSYVSANFIIIKYTLRDFGFTTSSCLGVSGYVTNDEQKAPLGRLIFACPKELQINKSNFNDPGTYDSNLFGNGDCYNKA